MHIIVMHIIMHITYNRVCNIFRCYVPECISVDSRTKYSGLLSKLIAHSDKKNSKRLNITTSSFKWQSNLCSIGEKLLFC